MKGFKKRVLPVVAFLACLAVIGGLGGVAYNHFYGPQPAPAHLQLTKDNFQKEVTSAKGLVYFYVCAKDRFACEQQSKQFDEFADKYGAKVKVAYVDAEKQQELVSALGIQSVLQLPAHFVVADGQLLGSFSGVFSADELAQLITQVVQNPQTQQQDGTAGGGTNATPQPSNTQDSKTPTPSGK